MRKRKSKNKLFQKLFLVGISIMLCTCQVFAKELPSETDENVTLGVPTIKSVIQNGKTLNITLTQSAKQLGGDGFEIQYKNPYYRDSEWLSVMTTESSLIIPNLSSSYKYLVRARAYRIIKKETENANIQGEENIDEGYSDNEVKEDIDNTYQNYSDGEIKGKVEDIYKENIGDESIDDELEDDEESEEIIYGEWSIIKPNIMYTSTGYKYYKSLKSLIGQKNIKNNKKMYRMLNKYASASRSHVIPGLSQTISTENGEKIILDDIVPQGLCKFGKYYLMTAYSSDKCYNSVVYVMDSKWRLVTTVTLPNNYHNGGVAYDSKGDVLWFVGYTPGLFVQFGDWSVKCVSGSQFRSAINRGVKNGKSAYMGNFTYEKIRIKNRPSCLDYSNGRLWVGSFHDRKSCKIVGYKTKGTTVSLSKPITITGLDSKLNGFAWDGTKNLYISYSYGRKSNGASHITRVYFKKSVKSSKNIKKSAKRKKLTMPKMNEELLIKDGYVYIVFESAAKVYNNSYNKVDRILAISKKAWKF